MTSSTRRAGPVGVEDGGGGVRARSGRESVHLPNCMHQTDKHNAAHQHRSHGRYRFIGPTLPPPTNPNTDFNPNRKP